MANVQGNGILHLQEVFEDLFILFGLVKKGNDILPSCRVAILKVMK